MQKNEKTRGFDTDFDTFWKKVLDMIEPATAFFLPELHKDIDWLKEYKSIEQELRGVFPQKKGNRRIDKLFRLHFTDGSERYILFHIEAEVNPGPDFPKRIFRYHALLTLKFDFTPITVLTLFVGDAPGKPLGEYYTNAYGTESYLKYNTFVVADQDEERLIKMDNPIALALLANLYVIKSRQNPLMRMNLKRKLVEHLHFKKVSLRKFNQILNFALHFIKLPEENEEDFQRYFFNTYDIQDMTGREKALAYGQQLKDNYVLFLKKKAEKTASEIQALEAQLKTQELRKSELENLKGIELQQAIEKMVNNLYHQLHISPEKIASTLELEIATVLQILNINQ